MKPILVVLLSLFTCFTFLPCHATPSQIVIIRHADKLAQPEPGPALTVKGQIRAIKFAFYYLNKFGVPDAMIATDVIADIGKGSSMREYETLAPLANLLQARSPQINVPILHPYDSTAYVPLAQYVLHNEAFNNKHIIICWNHTNIPQLAKRLGVKDDIKPWPAEDYDSVYVLNYNEHGELTHFEILDNQYPVSFDGSWSELNSMLQ